MARIAAGVGLGVALALLGCRREHKGEDAREQAIEAAPTSAQPEPVDAAEPELGAYLEGALIEASCDTTTLARLARSLPRPSPTRSPLVGVFGGIVDAFIGDPGARLDALGLRRDAQVRVSIRALDGRAAAVRKLLGELAGDAEPKPELLARLSSEGRTLGVHLRASLPTRDRARLLRALALLTVTDDDLGMWADACESLARVALCSGRPRLLLWARAEGEDRVRVDGVYLFYEGAEAADLDRALARADRWPGRTDAPEFDDPRRRAAASPAPLEILIHAGPTLALLEAEALADAVVAFGGGTDQPFEYPVYLDRERALRELYPEQRVFDGLGLALGYDDDRLTLGLRWLEAARPSRSLAELFAPIVERGTLPVVHGDCEAAQACVRIGGLSSMARFVPLAQGAFADSTGVTRVLRQAGERGQILLGLSSWPNLLGTAGAIATQDQGILGRAQSALLGDSFGLGLFLLELGDDPAASVGERWVGYLRVGPEVLAAVRPLATLAGISPHPVELAGVEAAVERASYDEVSMYLVDEHARPGGFGGWLLAADADERVRWLLETPREASSVHELELVWYLRVAALGPIAAREELAYSEDPPVREWLDGRSLELRARFTAEGPRVELELGDAGQ
ncbi:hypothetical protein ENSA5_47330 [Enhygromyxa salina]|uniref:Uncharacterized protein n=1 Tax=Enhygromyxa salina TaxID=215803 RepID=A0A2S9XJA7_9BACT|nr:hypothetical protein [Enhygromyxa salina]PRP92820.1 hypothetical protein ENSA5_47330 [Enhygromyxa salina]